jgi:REP element-mobilizing transposase RayT
MTFNPEQHHRRSIRLRDYDYTSPGAYFVTVCTKARECLFGEVNDDEMCLNDAGHLVESVWKGLPQHYGCIALDEFILMPNHAHGIGSIQEKPAPTQRLRNPNHALSEIVRAFKTFSARRTNEFRSIPGSSVWQRNYYEHIVRDDDALNQIRHNPSQWMFDQENPMNVR